MLDLVVKVVLAYLLGSVLGSLLVGRLKGGVDIRKQGSGNAGGTNALRTQGPLFAFWVMLIDIGKGWAAVAVIAPASLWPGAETSAAWSAVACAAAAVLGHVYPIWYGFRGGKGAATLVGVLIGLAPAALPAVLGVWLAVLLLTGYVGLSTMIATLSFSLWVWWQQPAGMLSLLVFSLCMSAFVVYTHRGNIERMRAGSEHRAQRLWLLKPRSPRHE